MVFPNAHVKLKQTRRVSNVVDVLSKIHANKRYDDFAENQRSNLAYKRPMESM